MQTADATIWLFRDPEANTYERITLHLSERVQTILNTGDKPAWAHVLQLVDTYATQRAADE